MSINIIKCTSTANITAKSRIPKYIVIHYTAGTTSKAGTAKNTAIYFSKPTTKASADFIVDDSNIVQYNPDPTKYYCWSVGGSKYRTMSTSEGGKYYRIVTNSNSVSIEICSSKINKKSLNASDTDWYFTDEVIERAIELTKYLMDLYNIPIENVIMHHSVNGKVCPNPFCVNESALNKWKEFKNRVNSYSTTSNSTTSNSTPSTTSTQSTPQSTAKTYTVKNGDTLSKIGLKTGIAWKTIADLNGIKSPYVIRKGQVLKLPTNNSNNSSVITAPTPSTPAVSPIKGYVVNGIDYSIVFDPTYYVNKYADLKKAFGMDSTKLFEHFLKYGQKEGRQAISTFNVAVYKNRYLDLQKAFLDDLPAYYKHYCQFGKSEGRSAV